LGFGVRFKNNFIPKILKSTPTPTQQTYKPTNLLSSNIAGAPPYVILLLGCTYLNVPGFTSTINIDTSMHKMRTAAISYIQVIKLRSTNVA
jgi:hypothetical protein